MRALWPRRSGTARLHFDLQGVLNGVQTIGEMLEPNINVKTAAAAVPQVQQSACQQKGTLEFFQDENPPLFVDASVRYTESRLDHWFLANDRRYICVC